MMLRRFFFAFIFSAHPAYAQSERPSQEIADGLNQAFRLWVTSVGAQKAVLSIHHNGAPQRGVAIGMAPDTLVELASLSKAVTAICAATLIRDRIWTEATTSHDLLNFGPEGITVVQLLTHSAGIAPDQTQALMMLWMTDTTPRAGLAAKLALNRRDQAGQNGKFAYNNENYAILGAMIEAETGLPYAEACAPRVLAPAGVTSAYASPFTGGMLPWGGWQMTAQNYAAFMYHWFGPDGQIGTNATDWPHVTVGGPVDYGLGMFQREVQGVHNFWHFGAWCMPGRLNVGSYAVIWKGTWSVVAAYDRCISNKDMVALDQALVAIVYRH